MKKLVLYLCVGVMVLGFAACGRDGQDGSQESGSGAGEGMESGASSGEDTESGSLAGEDSSAGDGTEQGASSGENDEPGNSAGNNTGDQSQGAGSGTAEPEGWSAEMQELRNAVVDALGEENYWPDMPMDSEMLEVFYGISSDMYEDYMAESPMISGNVDTLIIVKAGEGQADAVEEALNAYREANINDTMQYPQNLGKIQASQVERMDSYVIFVQLGGYAIEEEKEEDAIAQCKEANQLAIDTIREKLEADGN